MILLVIISNNILLSFLILFIYHFIPIGLCSQYTKFHIFIVCNWLFYIALLKNILAII